MLSAKALRTNGLRPCFARMRPPALNRPHLSRSRRLICPSASAFRISRRFLRAFSASLIRAFDDFGGRYMRISSSDYIGIYPFFEGVENIARFLCALLGILRSRDADA